MKESTIEKYLVVQVKTYGGYCIKLGGYVGIPDRMVLLPNGIVIFIELKTPIGNLSPLQKRWKQILEKLGFTHLVLRDKNSIDITLNQYKS
jgi:hypothetical protein